jgi:C4-type Zn-finger protein
MQDHLPASTELRPNFVLAAPTCPICKSDMRFVKTTPIVFTPGLVDVSYVCDECGQRTKRTLKRCDLATEARDPSAVSVAARA